MKPNRGTLPSEAIGNRVRARMAGTPRGRLDTGPDGWAADGRAGCRWSLTNSPFDIAEYEVIA